LSAISSPSSASSDLDAKPDLKDVSSLLASRICHDLISPMANAGLWRENSVSAGRLVAFIRPRHRGRRGGASAIHLAASGFRGIGVRRANRAFRQRRVAALRPIAPPAPHGSGAYWRGSPAPRPAAPAAPARPRPAPPCPARPSPAIRPGSPCLP